MTTAISASGVGKLYRQYKDRRDLLWEFLLRRKRHSELWALRDVSFQAREGEAFGLVGDNGAGKSTLLKILCGTTSATRGEVVVQGKVSALLELGAGFHPDFSGRANIYFSGAVMGLSHQQVEAREAEIIDFSELHDFIDQPVKTYSSGMYVRLGFAVATGFDPSVLIVDEALAVGDQSFQKKCTDRIMDFREKGGTILFCSHNLYQVRKLCDRALWLDRGRVRASGSSDEVIDRYQDAQRERERQGLSSSKVAQADGAEGPICRIERYRLSGEDGRTLHRFKSGETLRLEAWVRFSPKFKGTPGIGISIIRNDGVIVYTTSSTIDGCRLAQDRQGTRYGCIVFPSIPLLAGSYAFTIMATDQFNMQVYDAAEEVEQFIVTHPGPEFGVSAMQHFWSDGPPRIEESP